MLSSGRRLHCLRLADSRQLPAGWCLRPPSTRPFVAAGAGRAAAAAAVGRLFAVLVAVGGDVVVAVVDGVELVAVAAAAVDGDEDVSLQSCCALELDCFGARKADDAAAAVVVQSIVVVAAAVGGVDAVDVGVVVAGGGVDAVGAAAAGAAVGGVDDVDDDGDDEIGSYS